MGGQNTKPLNQEKVVDDGNGPLSGKEWTEIHASNSAAWVAMGDFNAIYREENRMIGAQFHEAEIKDFSIFIEDTGMNILKHNGREYTWSNRHTYSRIDWALVNAKWMFDMPIVEVMNRYAQNGITSLNTNEGVVVTKRCDIEREILNFYKQLLGTSANSLPAVNPVVMRNGPTLNRAQQLHLVEPVLRQEVRDALQGIRDDKALGCDGFNALFFKQSWHIVGKEITDAVLEFFNLGLVVNNGKSSIYSGGVPREVQTEIFIMPKKVVKCIEALCRNFLWSGRVDISKKALVAWEQLCRPYAAEGLNFRDIQTWNRAAINKLLWNLCKKKDRLWVKGKQPQAMLYRASLAACVYVIWQERNLRIFQAKSRELKHAIYIYIRINIARLNAPKSSELHRASVQQIVFLKSLVCIFKHTPSSTILLAGLGGSGKTFLFEKLSDGSAHQGTVTSMEPNEDSFILRAETYKKRKNRPVRVADVPLHSRICPKLDKFSPQAAGIVFLIIFLITDSNMLTSRKRDKLRTSRSAVPREPFVFSRCSNKVIVVEASGLPVEISDQLEQFIGESVKPRLNR
ncbi:hypothetical protein T459_31357 [Capsicum annuum]|uniref:Signal recognition particle receptor subunit beta n=1 Tax=Capsicum annuum TaxID=4072 RepID=A0A2G2YAZ9_CAPAN|nr:hypothetical protein T459_31357 [Capsicum annuum]